MQPTVIESQHPIEKQAIDICTMICRIVCSIRVNLEIENAIKNSQQTVRIPFYTDAMHLFENEDICFFSWCDNGITPTKPGLYILG